MSRQLRGRPRLPLTVRQVLEAVRKHGKVTASGRELGCSGGYIYARFDELGLTLAQVLDAPSADMLFKSRVLANEPGTERG